MTTKKIILIVAGVFVGIPATMVLILVSIGFVMAILDSDTYISEPEPTQSKVDQETKLSELKPADTTADKYADVAPNAKKEFVQSCMGEGASRSYCECVYEGADTTFTNNEFYELSKLPENEMLWVLEPIVESCL